MISDSYDSYGNAILLPYWADRISDGSYMITGTQLATKDGRFCGNGFVNHISWNTHPALRAIAHVITDAGSEIRLTLREMKEIFHKPEYIMKLDLARKRFIRKE